MQCLQDSRQTAMTADELDLPDSDIYHRNVYPYPYAADAYFTFPFTYAGGHEDPQTFSISP
jgi:hypothetical protein